MPYVLYRCPAPWWVIMLLCHYFLCVFYRNTFESWNGDNLLCLDLCNIHSLLFQTRCKQNHVLHKEFYWFLAEEH